MMNTLHALSALMPCHAALSLAAEARLRESSNTPRPGTRAKYVIVNRQDVELAILFHESISHSDAVNRQDAKPLSAGFYWINMDGSVSTDERGSESLRLKPRVQDAEVIENTLHLLGLLNHL